LSHAAFRFCQVSLNNLRDTFFFDGLEGFSKLICLFARMNVTGPALLTANNLALAYGHQRLLEAVTLSVGPGEKVGLLGRNGCGKTSLLRILAGHQSSDAGDVARRRGLRIGYLPQEFELDGK